MRTFVLLLAGWLLSITAQAQSKAPCKAPLTVKDISNTYQKMGVSITLKQRGVVLQEEAHVAPNCMVKIPAEGEYQVIVACKGYITQTVTLNLSCEEKEAPVVLLCPQALEAVNFEDGIDSLEATLIAGHHYNREGFSAREGTVKGTAVWECSAGSVSKTPLSYDELGLPPPKKNPKEDVRKTGKHSNKSNEPAGYLVSSKSYYIAIDKATGQQVSKGVSVTR